MIQRTAFWIFIVTLVPGAVFAASTTNEGIPISYISAQVFNFLLALGLLVYFSKKYVADHFYSRKQEFSELVSQAQEAKEQARQNKEQIQEKLEKLEANADTDMQRARAEAEEMKKRIVDDAQKLAEKLKDEAKNNAEVERQRTRNQLRDEVLKAAVAQAQEKLSQTVEDSDQERLQSEFVEKIQVVR